MAHLTKLCPQLLLHPHACAPPPSLAFPQGSDSEAFRGTQSRLRDNKNDREDPPRHLALKMEVS